MFSGQLVLETLIAVGNPLTEDSVVMNLFGIIIFSNDWLNCQARSSEYSHSWYSGSSLTYARLSGSVYRATVRGIIQRVLGR